MRARQVSCSFTGHRPEKLPWGDTEADMRCGELKKWLLAAVQAAYEQGFRHFLCGMARGSDLGVCEAVLEAYAMRRGIEIMDTPSVLEKKPCGV